MRIIICLFIFFSVNPALAVEPTNQSLLRSLQSLNPQLLDDFLSGIEDWRLARLGLQSEARREFFRDSNEEKAKKLLQIFRSQPSEKHNYLKLELKSLVELARFKPAPSHSLQLNVLRIVAREMYTRNFNDLAMRTNPVAQQVEEIARWMNDGGTYHGTYLLGALQRRDFRMNDLSTSPSETLRDFPSTFYTIQAAILAALRNEKASVQMALQGGKIFNGRISEVEGYSLFRLGGNKIPISAIVSISWAANSGCERVLSSVIR